jgi:hypothetical protein
MSKKVNRMDRSFCNKAKCKSCIFHTDGNALALEPGRLDEIKAYLLGSSSHICHTTNLTCYGALEYQAEMFYRLNWINEPTVDCLLDTAKKLLNL